MRGAPPAGCAGPGARQNVKTYLGVMAGQGCDPVKVMTAPRQRSSSPFPLKLPMPVSGLHSRPKTSCGQERRGRSSQAFLEPTGLCILLALPAQGGTSQPGTRRWGPDQLSDFKEVTVSESLFSQLKLKEEGAS